MSAVSHREMVAMVCNACSLIWNELQSSIQGFD